MTSPDVEPKTFNVFVVLLNAGALELCADAPSERVVPAGCAIATLWLTEMERDLPLENPYIEWFFAALSLKNTELEHRLLSGITWLQLLSTIRWVVPDLKLRFRPPTVPPPFKCVISVARPVRLPA